MFFLWPLGKILFTLSVCKNIISGIWQSTGWAAILYLAALSGIDPELYEAAKIDGTTRFQRIIYIDIPGILPTVVILFILNTGRLMNVGFEKTFLMQNPLNLGASEVILGIRR